MESNGYETLSFCQKLSPTGSVQQAFTRIYNNARKDHLSETDIVKCLLKALLDGLEFGNWPN